MLIAEELLLLLTTDDGKAEGWGTYAGYGMSGAVITDLILADRITLTDDKDPRVHLSSSERTGNPVLDGALERVAQKEGKKLSSLVQDGKLNPTDRVVASLAAAGIVGVEPKRMLGLVPEKRPTLDPGPERAVRDRLRTVLAGGTASVADACLLAILEGLGVAGAILKDERGTMSKRDMRRRIAEVADGLPAGTAVERSVAMMNTAIMTAAVIPAITTSTT